MTDAAMNRPRVQMTNGQNLMLSKQTKGADY